MANYYYLAASLPPLVFGERPDIDFVDLASSLAINLKKNDFEKTVVFRRYIDLLNIRFLILKEPIDPRGNFNEKELDEALLVYNILPSYVFDFLDRYESASDRINNFSALIARYFEEEIPRQKGFLHRYLIFEREWRLVMIGLRAKELGRDLSFELQFEDSHDPLVAQLLAQKDAIRYEPPMEYQELREIIVSCGEDPWERNRAFAAFRFHKMETLVQEPLFSIDWILAYMAQLLIIESINELDEKKGRAILDTFKAG